jgi:hypothetical protein
MRTIVGPQVSQLEAAKQEYGGKAAKAVEQLLSLFQQLHFRDALSLARFHDALLFLRAFPQSERVAKLCDKLLQQFGAEVARLRDSGADLDVLDSEQYSGIANTSIHYRFTYEVAQWVAQNYPEELSTEWDVDSQAERLCNSLPRFVPLLEDDTLVEPDVPYMRWMSSAAGGEGRELHWLLRQLERSPMPVVQKTEVFDSLDIEMEWKLANSAASRTNARREVASLFVHKEPLIQRKQVSLAEEVSCGPIELRKLSGKEAEDLLDAARAALTVRQRELYGTTRGDADQVHVADVGRGVQMFVWGVPAGRRLPLRAYLAGLTVKNGVPINYMEAIGLFNWMEVGFNTFYAFREGETAWIYGKLLHLLHQLTGINCVSVYPYQIGFENEEAIQSGAFWFYRKLGFRPGKAELLAIAEREERKIMRDPKYRTSARTLRQLANGHVFFEFGDATRGEWDAFSTRNIGFAVQQKMARDFDGNSERMRGAVTSELMRNLGVDFQKWSFEQREAFADYACVMALAPKYREWSKAEQIALVEIIRAKTGPSENQYFALSQAHVPLKRLFLQVGSSRKGSSSGP